MRAARAKGIRGGAVLAMLAVVAACGGGRAGEDEAGELAFAFKLKGGDGMIDQTLSIENAGDAAVAPSLRLVPLDASGEQIDGVTVRTAFGSDRGGMVVPSNASVFDVLRFEGAGARDVEDVKIDVEQVDEVDADRTPELPETTRLARGRPVADGVPFDAYRVTNPNAGTIKFRVALLEYEDPPPGESQQTVRVTQIAPLRTLPARGRGSYRMPRRLRGRAVGSVKAYFAR